MTEPRRRTSLFTWIVLFGIGIGVVGAIIGSIRQKDHAEEEARAEAARVSALSPEQKSAELAEKKKEAARKAATEAAWRTAQAAAAAIRSSAHDPSSVAFTSARYTDAGVIVFEFRAKNAFGALIKQVAILPKDGKPVIGAPSQDPVASAWNKHVANRELWPLPIP